MSFPFNKITFNFRILVVLGFAFYAHPIIAQSQDALDMAETVNVDWLEKIASGGVTMVVQGMLSLALIAFTVERLFLIRRKYICPKGLVQKASISIQSGDYSTLRKLLNKHPSTLSRMIAFAVDHGENDFNHLREMTENIGAREIMDQEERTFPLAVIAALAPMLGLLGTMIGMIEAFELVSLYGDEGGASMLAGSIAKALITTAIGLIIAIPSIALYHLCKHKIHKMGMALELDLEYFFTSCFLISSEIKESSSPTGSK